MIHLALFVGVCHSLASPTVTPLYAIESRCLDSRHPAMSNKWVSSCNGQGKIDALFSIETEEMTVLDKPVLNVGSVGSFAWAGINGGSWTGSDLDKRYRLTRELIAPPSVNDQWVVGVTDKAVVIKNIHTQKLDHIEANPKPWYPPAIQESGVAWVNDDGQGGEDIWLWSFEREAIEVLASGSAWQRSIAAWDDHWGWAEDDGIHILTISTGEHQIQSGQVVDGPIAWESGLCWTAIVLEDVDVFCSDGSHLKRPGEQRWPYRTGMDVVFQEQGKVMKWSIGDTSD